jgi:hypothetical protein
MVHPAHREWEGEGQLYQTYNSDDTGCGHDNTTMYDKIQVTVTYGPTGNEYVCQDPVVEEHSKVACTMSAGVGPKLHWKIYVHDQNSTV